MLKAIIDTNIWVSGLMKSSLTKPILDAFIKSEFQSIVSSASLKEIEAALEKPEITKRIDKGAAKEMLEIIAAKSRKHDPVMKLKVCRDPKDDFLFSMSVELDAPIVSLDKDVLVLSNQFNVLSPKEFLTRLKANP